MSSRKRISLRTPQLHGAYSSLLRGLVYEHLDPSERNHATDSQFPRRTRYQSHNGLKSHITRTPSHTLIHTHTHFSHTIALNIPSSHRRTHNTTFFSFRPAFEVFMLTKERCQRLFFAFKQPRKACFFLIFTVQEEGNRRILHACKDGRTYIPSSHRRKTQKLPCFKPAFIFLKVISCFVFHHVISISWA
jgi:hypothetical protein